MAAAYSKRRRDAVQPIRRDLADAVRSWLADRPADCRVFAKLPKHTARLLKADMRAARAAWIGEATTDAGRNKRAASDFLAVKNAAGEVVDFHATRHTYVSSIVAGGASVKTAQELARHSTPTLTIGRYAHTRRHDLTGALDALPDLTRKEPEPPAQQVEQATGTDSFLPANRQQWSGEKTQNVANRGERYAECLTPKMPVTDEPQVIRLAAVGNKKATCGGTWRAAEGTGLEPATGYPASDFECDAE